jgi:hypothetical protein
VTTIEPSVQAELERTLAEYDKSGTRALRRDHHGPKNRGDRRDGGLANL